MKIPYENFPQERGYPSLTVHGFNWFWPNCVFRGLSDTDSNFCRTAFRFQPDTVPIHIGQFSVTIGMVSDKIGRVSELARNGVRQGPESGRRRSGATLE